MRTRDKKYDKSSRLIPIFMGLLLVLILIAAAGYLYTRYARLNGEFVRTDRVAMDLRGQDVSDIDALTRFRDLKSLDLRDTDVTIEDVRTLQKRLPECEILYDVSLGGAKYESTTASLTLPDLPADWKNLLYFPLLRSLTVERCTNPAAMEELQEQLSQCQMRWALCLGGDWFDSATEEIALSDDAAYYEELLAQLTWFRSLKSLTLRSAVLTPDQQRSLLSAFPEVAFSWPVRLGDAHVTDQAEALVFSQTGLADPAVLAGVLDLLPKLRSVDFTGSEVSAADRIAFREEHPELDVSWSISLLGTVYPDDVEMLDFSGIAFADTAELEEALPYLPNLKQIDMCDTGLSNEALDSLNRRLGDDLKVVWTVYFSSYALRTDATYFCASAIGVNPPDLTDRHMGVFRYLTDMEALDLGHMKIIDFSFLEYMPKLKYLIIAETHIQTLEPLAACKELVYLEAFQTNIKDLSPLTELPKLESLNICYISATQKNAYENLMKMENLARLWYCHCPLNANQRAELQKKLPDCVFFLLEAGEPSGGSWRYNESYIAMRNALHMPRMPGGTNGLTEDGAQIIVDDWGQEFHLENFDNAPYWWTEERYSMYTPHIIGVTV